MSEKAMKLSDKLFALAGAVILTQFPLFMRQYQQHLAGHVAELRYQVYLMKEAAMQSGKTLDEFVAKFINSSDQDFSSQGALMKQMVERMESLSSSLVSLEESAFFYKPFVFLYHLDFSIAKASLCSFRLGLNFTFETAVYALIGLVAGYAFGRLMSRLWRRFKQKSG